MKKFNILVFSIIIISITLFSFLFFKKGNNSNDNKKYDRILYSWKLNKIEENQKQFNSVIKEYDINVIYQDFTTEYLQEYNDDFIRDMNKRGIVVYHMAGDPSWGKKDGFDKIREEIERLIDFNKNVENKMPGIVLDIEPYISEKEEVLKVQDFSIYVEQIKKAYDFTKENDLNLILAIPYWFDVISDDLLEEVIKNADHISVMNYKIDKTSEHISREIELARKYNKKIDTIYEINYDDHDYFSSNKDILLDYEKIKKNNNYEELGVSYHHFGSMLK